MAYQLNTSKQAVKSSRVLTKLLNVAIVQCTFLFMWKTAEIVPMHKSGPKNKCSNYRPISLLSYFSKIFEKYICDQLYHYFESNKILYDY